MMKKAIGRILFTFSCVLAMVLVFGLQASNIHVYALSGGTRTLTYVSQKVEWTGFGAGSYTIEYGGETGMFTSRPGKPSSGKVTVQVGVKYRTCAVCGKEDTAVIPHTKRTLRRYPVHDRPEMRCDLLL